MTTALVLGLIIYAGGCVPAFVFFMVGCAPSLLERNWHWPVIFLWPLLPLWPLHFVWRRFSRKKFSRRAPLSQGQPASAVG
jgi:hypothetical protein